jgi:quercetin dioxygenase-like cupin family protein
MAQQLAAHYHNRNYAFSYVERGMLRTGHYVREQVREAPPGDAATIFEPLLTLGA